MKDKIKYDMKAVILLFGLAIFFISLPMVDAFANTFLENRTMELYKGETGKYCIYLQNTGEENLTQVVKIFEGEEYIKNLDEVKKEFDIPAGTVSDDLPVCMKVELPRDAEKGEKYPISYGITSPASENKEGMISIAPVQITEKFYLTERLEEREDNQPIALHAIFMLTAATAILIIAHKYRRI